MPDKGNIIVHHAMTCVAMLMAVIYSRYIVTHEPSCPLYIYIYYDFYYDS